MAQNQPPRRQSPEFITALAEEATKLRDRLSAMADSTATEISKIDSRLKEPAQRDEERRIRALFAKASEPLATRLAELRGEASSQAQHFSREAIRARAEFDRDPVKNANIGLYWLQRLAAASLGELIEISRSAASEYAHALGLSVEREIHRRGVSSNERASEAMALVASIPLAPQDVAVAEKIKAALLDVDLTAIETREVATGRRDPEAKLSLGLDIAPVGRIRSVDSGELGANLQAVNDGEGLASAERAA